MSFRVQARTILQLGAELISSDDIALYELIKNASDAGAPQVDVKVTWILGKWPGEMRAEVERAATGRVKLEEFRALLTKNCDASFDAGKRWLERVKAADSIEALTRLARRANKIRISDKGHGMSLKDLDEIYLTIGTPVRLVEKENGDDRKRRIQGEKGLGRLSVMRLGEGLEVRTSKAGEKHWNVLKIDWRRFADDLTDSVADVKLAPERDEEKDDPEEQGTTIIVYDLNSAWSARRLEDYANHSLNRITDPFGAKVLFRVNLVFNDEKIVAQRMDTNRLKMAHGKVQAHFVVGGEDDEFEFKLFGSVEYHKGERDASQTFVYDKTAHLTASAGEVPPSTLRSLGPFSVEAYWFNRQALQKDPALSELKDWVNLWSGGPMLFRDGFRVHPYGGPEDDWLSLDKKALASGGYKLNRRQIIGKVDISTRENPALTDQTNREGLRQCPEKDALVKLLQFCINELRSLANEVEEQQKKVLDADIEVLEARAEKEKDKLKNTFNLLKHKHPQVRADRELVSSIEHAIDQLDDIIGQANQAAEAAMAGREQLVHLAGLGLMVEMLAHELNRTTQAALQSLADAREQGDETPSLSSLEMQLKTLSKRLRTLDPATTSGRNRRETFDLVGLVHEIVEAHAPEFERHRITCEVKGSHEVRVKMVKGMVVQVLENLISNSAYWLKTQARIDDEFQGKIVIDVGNQDLSITDNGPGVSESIRERLFTPFFTTKPPGQGKGLGLFISRDIAKYHDCQLSLSRDQRIRKGQYNTFVLSLPSQKE